MKFRLLNDCSQYHVGSALVASQIKLFLRDAGAAESQTADTLVVNGEGTFHHDAPASKRIIEALLQNRGVAKVVFLNGVWQNMTRPVPDVSFACLRDSLSEREFKGLHPHVKTSWLPDISLSYTPKQISGPRRGVLFIDSVDPKVSDFLKQGAKDTKADFLEMCDWRSGYDDLIQKISSYEAVVTGRYHGATFSMLAGTPFICSPSNTWKTRALLADLGKDGFFHKDLNSVKKALLEDRLCSVSNDAIQKIRDQWRDLIAQIVQTKSSSPVSNDAACVLVGNGPSLLSKRLGSVIDAHDEVVRFNCYKTAGFEKHVGSKTTVWSTFGKGTDPETPNRFQKVLFIHGDRGDPTTRDKKVFRIPISFYEGLRSEIRSISNHKKAASVNPTSGFLVARWLLSQGVKHISLAGFDHFSKATCSQHHYWDTKAYGRPEDHDGDAERLLLIPWLHAGRLSYLT